MNFLLSNNVEDNLAFSSIILIAILVIGLVFLVISAVASVYKLVLVSRYNRFNRQKVTAGMTGSEVATKLLEGLGLTDVKVEKLGFWKGLFVGNSYSPKKKAVRLRSNIYDKASLTAVALASQKVAIAQRHHEGDKKVAVRAVLMRFGYFAPFSLIPLILIGVLLDFVCYGSMGIFSSVLTAISFVYFIFALIVVILNLKIEKKACNTAIEYMKTTNLLAENELEDAQYLYKTYITNYVLEFLYNIAFIVWELFKLIFKGLFKKNEK